MPTRREDDAAPGRALDVVELLPGRGGAGGDVVQSGSEPSAWERRWRALPPAWRQRLTAGAVVAVTGCALVAGGAQAREWLADRSERQRVSLSTSVVVSSSSTTPRGGHVSYFVEIHNAGSLPLGVASVRAEAPDLQVSARDGRPRQVPAGGDVLVPLSVLLTCPPAGPAGARDGGLPAAEVDMELEVDRADGERTRQRLPLLRFTLISNVAGTLCTVRPDLRDYELSGPLVRAATVDAGG